MSSEFVSSSSCKNPVHQLVEGMWFRGANSSHFRTLDSIFFFKISNFFHTIFLSFVLFFLPFFLPSVFFPSFLHFCFSFFLSSILFFIPSFVSLFFLDTYFACFIDDGGLLVKG